MLPDCPVSMLLLSGAMWKSTKKRIFSCFPISTVRVQINLIWFLKNVPNDWLKNQKTSDKIYFHLLANYLKRKFFLSLSIWQAFSTLRHIDLKLPFENKDTVGICLCIIAFQVRYVINLICVHPQQRLNFKCQMDPPRARGTGTIIQNTFWMY